VAAPGECFRTTLPTFEERLSLLLRSWRQGWNMGEATRRPARTRAGTPREENPQPSAAIADRQSVKTTPVGGAAGGRGYDGGKKVKGRKRHLLVDTQGLVLEVRIHSAKKVAEIGKASSSCWSPPHPIASLPPVAGGWLQRPGHKGAEIGCERWWAGGPRSYAIRPSQFLRR
jgi:hypothetical protein